MSGPPLRVLVLGWHGSRERHLRPVTRTWESLGLEAVPIVPDAFGAMSRRGGWERQGRRLRAHVTGGRWLAHAFSNAGFWSLCGLLESAEREAPEVAMAHGGTVLDSAPGFPEKVSPLFTAKYAAMAMTPSVLGALGRPVRETHPLVTPPLAVLLGLWHLLAPHQVHFMEASQAAFLARHRHKPLLAVYGGADRLVRPKYVESFLARAEAADVPTERLYFPASRHVRHFVEHRHEITENLEAFVARLGVGASA